MHIINASMCCGRSLYGGDAHCVSFELPFCCLIYCMLVEVSSDWILSSIMFCFFFFLSPLQFLTSFVWFVTCLVFCRFCTRGFHVSLSYALSTKLQKLRWTLADFVFHCQSSLVCVKVVIFFHLLQHVFILCVWLDWTWVCHMYITVEVVFVNALSLSQIQSNNILCTCTLLTQVCHTSLGTAHTSQEMLLFPWINVVCAVLQYSGTVCDILWNYCGNNVYLMNTKCAIYVFIMERKIWYHTTLMWFVCFESH